VDAGEDQDQRGPPRKEAVKRRRCTDCRKFLSLKNFYQSKGSVCAKCKACIKIRTAEKRGCPIARRTLPNWKPGHDDDNEKCPWNDPETFANPATAGLPCSCPEGDAR